MSSLPGYDLEDYLAWNYSITVQDQPEANFSVGLAEMLGNVTRRRPHLTQEEFAVIVKMYEPHRENIEDKLSDFDEDNQSWRDYACYEFGNVPDELEGQVIAYLDELKKAKQEAAATS